MEPVEVVLRVAGLTVVGICVLVVLMMVRTARARREWEREHRGHG